MALASLLNIPNDPRARRAWVFDHAMAHRDLLGTLVRRTVVGTAPNQKTRRSPLSRFSAIPYFVDPMLGEGVPAGNYHLNHQQAHDDALRNLPIKYGWQFIYTTTPNPTPPPPTITTQTEPKIAYGLRIGGNLIDFNLSQQRQRRWWTFQNHIEHYVAAQTVLPAASPKPAPQWTFPFW